MQSNRYVFLNSDNVVVQSIDGNLTESDLEVFMRDYKVLFDASYCVLSEPSLGVMPGWTYDGIDFHEPEPAE